MMKTEKSTNLPKTIPRKPVPVLGAHSPFGTVMQNRSFSSPAYRYGFNGKEKDAEVYGEGNAYDFGARIYDSRLGRFFNPDQYSNVTCNQSPYVFAGSCPIRFIDKEGNYKIDPDFTRQYL